jgi:SAM-dependent methyltransferase
LPDLKIRRTLYETARFYDHKKVGDVGALGFRRSTDLSKLQACLDEMFKRRVLDSGRTRFLDMGCGDGRVNVFLSYLVKKSVGVEIDDFTLDDYRPLRKTLEEVLTEKDLPLPPGNISLFHGDTLDPTLHMEIQCEAGVGFEDFDLFYTYLTMHEEFSELIVNRARRGAHFIIYGVEKIIPKLKGMKLITPEPMENILVIYKKR